MAIFTSEPHSIISTGYCSWQLGCQKHVHYFSQHLYLLVEHPHTYQVPRKTKRIANWYTLKLENEKLCNGPPGNWSKYRWQRDLYNTSAQRNYKLAQQEAKLKANDNFIAVAESNCKAACLIVKQEMSGANGIKTLPDAEKWNSDCISAVEEIYSHIIPLTADAAKLLHV